MFDVLAGRILFGLDFDLWRCCFDPRFQTAGSIAEGTCARCRASLRSTCEASGMVLAPLPIDCAGRVPFLDVAVP